MFLNGLIDLVTGAFSFGKNLISKGGKIIMSLFNETGIGNSIFNNLIDAGFSWDVSFNEPAIKGVLEGMAAYLATVKGDKPQAVTVKDDDGKVIFGAMVEKESAEEGKGYGITYFFDDSNLDDKVNCVDIESPEAYGIVSSTSFATNSVKFCAPDGHKFLAKVLRVIIKSLVEYVRNTYKECNIIEIPNYFKLEAHIDEDNKLHLVMTPEAVLKQYIKDDKSVATA